MPPAQDSKALVAEASKQGTATLGEPSLTVSRPGGSPQLRLDEAVAAGGGISFEAGRSELTAAGQRSVLAAAMVLKENSAVSIQVNGYVGQGPSSPERRQLVIDRTCAVRIALKCAGCTNAIAVQGLNAVPARRGLAPDADIDLLVCDAAADAVLAGGSPQAASPQEEAEAPSPVDADQLITVTLTKPSVGKCRLGLNVDQFADPSTLPIKSISGGLAGEWNNKNADKLMAEGDVIIEVNGVSGDVISMMEKCRDEQVLKLVIKKKA